MPIRVERLKSGDYEVSDITGSEAVFIYKETELPPWYRDKLALLYLQEPGMKGNQQGTSFGWRFSDTVFYLSKEGF